MSNRRAKTIHGEGGRRHGTDMLTGGQGKLIKQAVVQILERLREQ